MVLLELIGDVIPTAILHYQYYRWNSGWKLLVDKTVNTITIIQGETTTTFSFTDIEKIVVSMGYASYRGQKGGMNIFDLYHYAFLEINADTTFIITCLLVNDLSAFFKDLGLNFEKERRFYMWIDMDRYISPPEKRDE